LEKESSTASMTYIMTRESQKGLSKTCQYLKMSRFEGFHCYGIAGFGFGLGIGWFYCVVSERWGDSYFG